jgi:hypothetical protein
MCCCSHAAVVREGWVPFSLSSGDCELICCGGSSNGLVIVSSSRRRLVVSNGGSEIWDMLVVKLSRSRWLIDGVPLAAVITGAIAFCIQSRKLCCMAVVWCNLFKVSFFAPDEIHLCSMATKG